MENAGGRTDVQDVDLSYARVEDGPTINPSPAANINTAAAGELEAYEAVGGTDQQPQSLYDYADVDRKRPPMTASEKVNGTPPPIAANKTQQMSTTTSTPNQSLPMYAQVQKQPSPKHPPPVMYAQVQKPALRNQELNDTTKHVVHGVGVVQPEEGWSDNIVYEESSFDGNVISHQHGKEEVGLGNHGNTDEGWSQNIIYDTSENI